MTVRIHTAVKRLISKHFSEDLKNEVEELVKNGDDFHLVNYSILELALENELVYGTADLIKGFYGSEDLSLFNLTDVLIAKIIITLENLTGEPVKEKYYEKLSLEPSAPELCYLADLINFYKS